MGRATVKFLCRWFYLYPICVLVIVGCGRGGAADALQVQLAVAGEESPELFWLGVERREMEILSKDGVWTIAWRAGTWQEESLREGDTLRFRGFDGAGHLLVTGEVRVGPEKRISIPVRRIL